MTAARLISIAALACASCTSHDDNVKTASLGDVEFDAPTDWGQTHLDNAVTTSSSLWAPVFLALRHPDVMCTALVSVCPARLLPV